MRAWLWLVALSVGCADGVYATRTGTPMGPNALDCQPHFEYYDAQSTQKLNDEYVAVGELDVSYLGHQEREFRWTDDIEHQLQPEACRLGGDLVAFIELDWKARVGAPRAKFRVFRKK